MDGETMRKRGWSIQSEQTATSDDVSGTLSHDDESLNDDEKKNLLNSFPAIEEEEEPPAKRQKVDDENAAMPPTEETDIVQVAKQRLSRWAARLFDPDRPRSLIETPEPIPLNDEFLAAFGKREREFDDKVGRSLGIQEETIADDSDQDDLYEDLDAVTENKKEQEEQTVEERKVKITNLAYATTLATLEAACQAFGPTETVNLITDKEKPELNIGRAYVTYESATSAQACIEGLQTLDGRRLRISLAPMETSAAKRGGGRKAAGGRYWEKDISTICFRCGEVGHMEADCQNAAKPKPCPLCAGTDHEMRACPNGRICFRCGIPGHINRECSYRQNLPRRVVCGICFQSGHHRCSCRRGARDAPSYDGVCFVCHKRGHFMCRDMKWFFGLGGITCFNCGRHGHHGYDCDRPGVDVCTRDEEVAIKEIERAEAMSLADELDRQRMGGDRGRSRGRDRDFQADRARAQSQPPPRGYRPSSRDGYRPTSREGDRRRSPQKDNRGRRGYDGRR